MGSRAARRKGRRRSKVRAARPRTEDAAQAAALARYQYSTADWARMLSALLILCFGPTAALAAIDPGLPIHQHTGWFARALLAVPATLLCGVVLWPPVWWLCRGTAAAPMAKTVAVLYTPVNAFVLVGVVNVGRDTEPGREVVIQYVRFEDRYKGPDIDVLTSWTEPGATVSLTSGDTLLRAEDRVPGMPVSLTIHPGWLGLEWVSQVQARR